MTGAPEPRRCPCRSGAAPPGRSEGGGRLGAPCCCRKGGLGAAAAQPRAPRSTLWGAQGGFCLLHPSVFSHLRAGWRDAGIVPGKAGHRQHLRGCSEPLKSPWPFLDSGPHLQTPATVWMRHTLMFCCAKSCCWCWVFPPSSPPLAGRQHSPPRCAERARQWGAA